MREICKYFLDDVVCSIIVFRMTPTKAGASSMPLVLIGSLILFLSDLSRYPARAQVFVTDYERGTVGEYTLSGVPINRTLISGLDRPVALAQYGNGFLYVSSIGVSNNCTIGVYTMSGVPINAALITGLNEPFDFTLDNQGHIY